MSSTEATLENHKVRLASGEKRLDRIETIMIAVAGAIILQLLIAGASLALLVLKGKP